VRLLAGASCHLVVYRKETPKTCPAGRNEPRELLATITPTTLGSRSERYAPTVSHRLYLSNDFGVKRRTADVSSEVNSRGVNNNNIPSILRYDPRVADELTSAGMRGTLLTGKDICDS